jgi:hypothetical protein
MSTGMKTLRILEDDIPREDRRPDAEMKICKAEKDKGLLVGRKRCHVFAEPCRQTRNIETAHH